MKNSRSFSSGQIFCTVFFALAALALFTLPARAQTWTGAGGGNLSTNSSWTANVTSGNTTDLTFSSSNANATSTSTPAFTGANMTIRSLNFDANADSDVFIRLTSTASSSTARTLTFQAASGSANLTIASGATGNYTIGLSTGSVVLGGNLLVDHSGTGNLTIDRPITGTGFGITKNGTGALTLSGANTFTGGVTLNTGRLNINNTIALGSATTGAFVINGGTIDNTSGGTITVGAKPLTINGDFTFNGTNALSLGNGSTTLGTAAGTSRTITVNANTLTIAGVISNGTTATGIIKEGAGTLWLIGSNTFNGGLTINSGTVATGTVAGFGAAGNTVSFGGAAGNGTILIQKNAANAMLTNLDVTATNGLIISDTTTASGAGVTHSMVNARLGNEYQLSIRGGSTVGSGTARFDLTGLTTMAGNASIALLNNLSGVAATRFTANGTTGTGNLTLKNNSSNSTSSITLSTISVNHNGTITNSGNGTGSVTISAGIGSNVTGVIQNSTSSSLNLSGSNTYTSTTTISAGTLAISGGSAIADIGVVTLGNTSGVAFNVNASETIGSLQGGGANGGNVSIASAQTLTVAEANTNTFSGSIQGAGNLVKTGVGTLTLNGSNTYTGTTTIGSSNGANAGTLRLSGSGAISNAATTIFGGTLDLNGVNQSITTLAMGGGAAGSAAAITTGSGTLTIGGNVTYSASNNPGSATIAGNVNLGGAARTFTVGSSTGSGDVDLLVSANLSNDGGSGLTKAGAGVLELSGVNSYTGNTTISSGTLRVSSIANQGQNSAVGAGSMIELAGNSSLVYTGSGVTTDRIISLNANGASQLHALNQSGNGLLKFTSDLALSGNFARTITLTGSSSGSGEFAGNIVDFLSTNKTSVTKNGAGTWTLSGNNSYTGNTTVSGGGLLIVGSANGISGGLGSSGGTSGINLLSGILGLTEASGNLTRSHGNTATTIKLDGSLSSKGFAAFGDNRSVRFGNSTTSMSFGVGNVFQGVLVLGHSTADATLNFENGLGLTIGETRSITVNNGSAAIDGIISGSIITTSGTWTNSSILQINGNGTLAFTGALNTFGGASAAGQTFLAIDQATLQIGNHGTTGMIGSGANATVQGDIDNNGVLSFALTTNQTLANIIKGNGSVSNVSTGTITLSGANTYSGGTTISAGRLALSGNGSLGTGSIQITGGELNMGGKSITNSLASLSGGTLSNGTLTNDGGNYSMASGTVSAVLAGTNGLNKSTSGVLTLSGNNTYSGATTINAGTLYANGNIANSAVTINSGATLSGTAQIGNLVVNSGATVAPGATSANNAFANLSVNTLILNGGGNYSVKIGQASGGVAGTNWDLITVGGGSGSVTINAAVNNTFGIKLNGSAMSDFSAGQSYSWNIMDWGSVTGFDTSYFAIDTTNFGQAFTGTFSLANTSGYLQLSYSAGASTPNWTGGSGDWSAGFGVSLTTGSPLEFSGASSAVATNNIASGTLSSVAGITFSNGAGAFTLNATAGSAGFDSSTPLGITESIVNNSNNTQTINLALSYGSSELVRALSGNIVLNGAVATSNSSIVTFEGDNTKTINGVISGSGGITQSGNGSTILNAQNTYTGTTAVNSGTLQLAGSANLGGGNYSQAISNNGTLDLNTTENQILSGAISGTGALVKSNTGNLTLRGANSYSGNTTINAGAIFVEDAGILGSASYAGSILNNGTLAFRGTASQSLNGIISGSGGLTFNGSGTTTLAASNTYSGATVINSGTVSVSTLGNGSVAGSLGNSSSAATNLVLGGGTLLASNNSSSNRSFMLQNGTTSTISVNSGVNLTISGTTAATTGSFVKDGLGTLSLHGTHNYSGSTTINLGTLTFASSASLGAGNYSSNIVFSNSSTLRWESSASQILSGDISGAGGLNLNNAASTLVLSGSNSYSGTTTLNAGTIRLGNNNSLGTGSLLFNGGGAIMSTDSSSRTITNSFASAGSSNFTITFGNSTTQTGNLSFSGNLNLNGSSLGTTKTFNVLNTTTFNGVISNSNSALTKNGSGTLVLSGNNTYGTLGSTVTTLNNGTLQIGSNSEGSVANITSSAIGKGGLTLNGGKISSDSSTSRTLLNAVIFGGNVNLGDTINNGNLTFSAAANLGGATRVLTVDSGVTFGGVVSNGSITKAGSGVLTLSGANTYSGGTQLNAGTVVLGHADGLGSTGTITLGGGTLQYGSGITTDLSARFSTAASQQYAVDTNGNDVTFATGLTSSGGNLTKSGLGTLILGGSNTFDGSTTISAGNLSISSTAALASTSGISLGDTAALIYTGAAASFDRNISVTSGTGTIRNTGSGLLTLSGTLTKNGTTLTLAGGSSGITVSGAIGGSNANSDLVIDGGSVTLASANSYNGPTSIINGATLTASATNALPTTNGRSAISIDATGTGSSTLALGTSQSVASLTGVASSNVTLGSNTLTIGTTSGNTTFAGRITGGSSSALVKDGASTQTLTGNNSAFTGTTTINSGTLVAGAANAAGGASNVIINNGGSFLVTADNAVGTNTAIELNGGRMAMSGNFNENVGALTLSANSTIDFAGFSGILRFSGIGFWAANATLSIWNWSGTTNWGTQINNYQTPSRLVFADNSIVASNLNNINFYSDNGNSFIGKGFEEAFSQSGFSGTEIIAVPEAETYIAAAILLTGYGIFHLRRRAKRKPLEGHRPA